MNRGFCEVMVAGSKRTRCIKKTQVVVPSGKVVTRYKRKAYSAARCQLTGQKLNGVPRTNKTELRKMPKSSRRPTRPFGGVLCPAAMRRVLIERVRD